MATQWFLFLNLINILLLVDVTHSAAPDARKAYIVYMGDKPKNDVPHDHHVNIIRDIVGNNINNDITHEALLLHSYKRSFHGFSAMLTEQEAQKMAVRRLKTTKSWDFMGFPETVKRNPALEREIIVGVIDSGIWPESDSFNDAGFGPPPKRWKGICQGNGNFTCNNKIIGARYYRHSRDFKGDVESPRDTIGHGSHTSSTIAGNTVPNASQNGLGLGTARGGVPSAHIAVYKACWNSETECDDADNIAAFDDAIADGVDIISVSLGGEAPDDCLYDTYAIGAFHAMKNGILVSISAGNEGPARKSLANFARWQLVVAAVNTNRQFVTKIQLGNVKIFEGLLPNSHDQRGRFYPLIPGQDATNMTKDIYSHFSCFCYRNSLDADKIRGKIVLCDQSSKPDKDGAGVLDSGAIGDILTGQKISDAKVQPLPMAAIHVGLEENSHIYKYINETRNPTASIWRSEEVDDVLAPYIPFYSSRGPNPMSPNILKPDIAAPGTLILAAYPPDDDDDSGRARYALDTGTSMACPHVTAIAAYVKSFYPDWSPAAIQSAIMTTATPMSAETSQDAEFAYGAGLLNPSRAQYPGLVYDLGVQDYIDYLCSEGYTGKRLDQITGDKATSCSSSKSDNETGANDLNYPSFALSVKDIESVNGVFHRTVTNVGSASSTYRAQVVAPQGLEINVNPNVLSFTSLGQKKSFVVTIKGCVEKSNLVSASLVWDDGIFHVRSPIVVYVVV